MDAFPEPSFQTALAPLANHFFPDGCPIVDLSEGILTTATPEEVVYMQQIWPASSSRVAISAASAIQSIAVLRQYATLHGLMTLEMVAIAFLAASTLPTGPSKVHSSVQDGSTVHFCSLVRSLLPQNNGLTLSAAEKELHNKKLVVVASRLISSCSHFGVVGRVTEKKIISDEHAKAKCCVLQFLNLVILFSEEFHWPDACMSAVYQWTLQPLTCVDAARVLWYCCRQIPLYRLNQLRAFSRRTKQLQTTAKVAVADLLERYDDDQLMETSHVENNYNDWLIFPDEAWKLDYFGVKRLETNAFGNELSNYNSLRRQSTESMDHRLVDQKRSRRSSRNIQKITAHIRNTTSLSSSSDDVDRANRAQHTVWAATGTVCDMLADGYIQNIAALSWTAIQLSLTSCTANEPSSDCFLESDDEILRRFRSILLYTLGEQWYERPDEDLAFNVDSITNQAMKLRFDQGSDESSRLRLLNASVAFAQYVGSLPIEAQVFILQNILPVWDRDCDSELGCALLNVLSYIQPPSIDMNCCPFAEFVARGLHGGGAGKLFYELERQFIYGNERLQYAIVSTTLAGLVFRWGLLDWSSSTTASSGLVRQEQEVDGIATKRKLRVLQQLCQWTEDLLLKGFLATGDDSELLRAAAVDFYHAICDLAEDHEHSELNMPLALAAAPSPSIMYRLLASPSVVHIDRVCHLMVRYKVIFQKWKEQHTLIGVTSDSANYASGMTCIKVYNCFVWDFCSVLWRCSPPPRPQNEADSTAKAARAYSIMYTDLRPTTLEILYTAASTQADSEGLSLSSALSITHGAVFAGYVTDFLQHLVRDPGSGNQSHTSANQIRGSIKLQYLDYLKSRGLHGIHEFLSTFVDKLAARWVTR